MLEERQAVQHSFWRKMEALRTLIRRNRTKPADRMIGFPFFIVEPADVPGTDLKIMLQADLLKLKLSSNHHMTLFGDLEAIAEVPSLSGIPPF